MSFLVSDVTGIVYSNWIPRFVYLVQVYWLVSPRDSWHCFHTRINAYQRWIQRLDQSSCDRSDSGAWIIFCDQELCIFNVNMCCLYHKDGRICFNEVRFHLYLAENGLWMINLNEMSFYTLSILIWFMTHDLTTGRQQGCGAIQILSHLTATTEVSDEHGLDVDSDPHHLWWSGWTYRIVYLAETQLYGVEDPALFCCPKCLRRKLPPNPDLKTDPKWHRRIAFRPACLLLDLPMELQVPPLLRLHHDKEDTWKEAGSSDEGTVSSTSYPLVTPECRHSAGRWLYKGPSPPDRLACTCL